MKMKQIIILLFGVLLLSGCSNQSAGPGNNQGHEHSMKHDADQKHQEEISAVGMKGEANIGAAEQVAASSRDKNDENDIVACPVMGTKIKISKAYDKTVYKGKTYYFCCSECKPEFLKNPEKFAR